jgi:hypothetical protein
MHIIIPTQLAMNPMKENATKFTPPAILRVSKSSVAGINMHRPIVNMAMQPPKRIIPVVSQRQIAHFDIVLFQVTKSVQTNGKSHKGGHL